MLGVRVRDPNQGEALCAIITDCVHHHLHGGRINGGLEGVVGIRKGRHGEHAIVGKGGLRAKEWHCGRETGTHTEAESCAASGDVLLRRGDAELGEELLLAGDRHCRHGRARGTRRREHVAGGGGRDGNHFIQRVRGRRMSAVRRSTPPTNEVVRLAAPFSPPVADQRRGDPIGRPWRHELRRLPLGVPGC